MVACMFYVAVQSMPDATMVRRLSEQQIVARRGVPGILGKNYRA
jgi:hypothetical protein